MMEERRQSCQFKANLDSNILFKFIEIKKQMGQTCNGLEQDWQPQPAKVYVNTFSTAAPNQQSQIRIDISQSRLLQSRTSNIKRRNDNLSETIKMRLSQLPDISRLKKGNFGDDKRIYIDSLKAQYYGEVQKGKPYGFGALEFDNGDYLQGQFVEGLCEGKGRYIKQNGSYYEGDFRNNVADGYGKFFDKTGYRYEGQWKNNLPNGRGEAIYPDESRYNGEFLNNRRHGSGVLMQKKCIFEGNFANNKLEGTATMQNQNGESYSGQWKQNEKHGKGTYRWPNGNKYEGEYKFGKRSGFGIMSYANGEFYEGDWIDGIKEGDGTYKTSKASIRGIWRKGQLIEEKN